MLARGMRGELNVVEARPRGQEERTEKGGMLARGKRGEESRMLLRGEERELDIIGKEEEKTERGDICC